MHNTFLSTAVSVDTWLQFSPVGPVFGLTADQHHTVTTVPLNRLTHRTEETEREREMFYLTTNSTHFIYGYMASDTWLRTILIVKKETRCRHIRYSYRLTARVRYSYRLTARVLLYAPSHRKDNTYHRLCYTSRGALDGTRNSSMGRKQDNHKTVFI